MTNRTGRLPAARASRGDLVVAETGAADGPEHEPVFEVGVVSRTDHDGWVTAFEDARGATKPVAFMPNHEDATLLLVPRDRIDVPAAVHAARAHGPFRTLDEVRSAARPLLQPAREAEMEAGS